MSRWDGYEGDGDRLDGFDDPPVDASPADQRDENLAELRKRGVSESAIADLLAISDVDDQDARYEELICDTSDAPGASADPPAWWIGMPAPEPAPAPVVRLVPEQSSDPADVPKQIYKLRIVLGSDAGTQGNVIHVITRREPTQLPVDDHGMLDLARLDPVDAPEQSDRILFLRASAIVGLSYRTATSAKMIAKALGLPPATPEDLSDPSTLVVCPAEGCDERNAPKRRACRRCGCSLRSAKPKAPKAPRKSRKADTSDRAEPKRKAKRAPRPRRERGEELSTCLNCGSVHPRDHKSGTCPRCGRERNGRSARVMTGSPVVLSGRNLATDPANGASAPEKESTS